MAGSSFTTAAAGQPEEQQGLLTKQGHGSPSFSTSRTILHHVWTPLLVLALVVVSMLYLDCSSAAKRQANEVAIQLLDLDGSTVHQRDSASVRFTSQDQNSTANSPQRDHTLDDAMKQAAADTPHAAALAAAQLDPPDPMPPAEPADTTTPVPQLAAEPQLAATAAPPAAAAPAVVVPDLNTRTEPILPDIATRVLQLDKQQQGKRVIAMSLYGTQERCIKGAVGNAMLARRDWHGWTFRVYYGDGVPQQVLQILQAFVTELIRVNRMSVSAEADCTMEMVCPCATMITDSVHGATPPVAAVREQNMQLYMCSTNTGDSIAHLQAWAATAVQRGRAATHSAHLLPDQIRLVPLHLPSYRMSCCTDCCSACRRGPAVPCGVTLQQQTPPSPALSPGTSTRASHTETRQQWTNGLIAACFTTPCMTTQHTLAVPYLEACGVLSVDS